MTILIRDVIQIISFFLLFWLVFNRKEKHPIYTKKALADYYEIDIKTLSKWVRYFGQSAFPNHEDYRKRKRLSFIEYHFLITIFGPKEMGKALSKKEIIEQGEGTYKTLRGSVERYPATFGIEKEAFRKLKKFPPRIGQQILAQYG